MTRALVFSSLFFPTLAFSRTHWSYERSRTRGVLPDARQGQAAVTVGDSLFVVGGCEPLGGACFNDVHRLRGVKPSSQQQQQIALAAQDSSSNGNNAAPPRKFRWETVDTGANSNQNSDGDFSDTPEGRSGHALVALDENQVLLIGGTNYENTFGDVYKLDLVAKSWNRVAVEGDAPQLANHVAATDGSDVYVFGGFNGESYTNQTWKLEFSESASPRWLLLEANQTGIPPSYSEVDVPCPRESGSLTHMGDSKFLLYGGYTDAGATVGDIHELDAKTGRWRKIELADPLSPSPVLSTNSQQDGNAASRMSMMQGRNSNIEDSFDDDEDGPRAPQGRQGHAALRHGRELVILGGCELKMGQRDCFSDAWAFHVDRRRWRQLLAGGNSNGVQSGQNGQSGLIQSQSTSANSFSPREGLAASLVGAGEILVYGGCDDVTKTQCFNDLALIQTHEPCGGVDANCNERGQCVSLAEEDAEMDDGISNSNPNTGASAMSCRCDKDYRGLDCMDRVAAKSTECTGPSCPSRFFGLLNSTMTHMLAFGRGNASAFLTDKNGRKTNSTANASALNLLDAAKKEAPVAPKVMNFGVHAVAPKGTVGIVASECQKNCNYKGICQAKLCYCQHNFYGDHCQHQTMNKKATFHMDTVLIIGVNVFVIFFLMSFCMLQLQDFRKHRTERAMGYSV